VRLCVCTCVFICVCVCVYVSVCLAKAAEDTLGQVDIVACGAAAAISARLGLDGDGLRAEGCDGCHTCNGDGDSDGDGDGDSDGV
jgi:hypothetical protein